MHLLTYLATNRSCRAAYHGFRVIDVVSQVVDASRAVNIADASYLIRYSSPTPADADSLLQPATQHQQLPEACSACDRLLQLQKQSELAFASHCVRQYCSADGSILVTRYDGSQVQTDVDLPMHIGSATAAA